MLPHLISASFRWQSIFLLGGVALACLALDLLFLFFYSIFLCCRRSKNEEQPNADCCCTAWCVIIATLVCRLVSILFPGIKKGGIKVEKRRRADQC